MPKKIPPLSDTQIRKAKPKDKVYYLRDGNGLVLQINPSGSKIWLFDYINPITKKRSTYTIGHYPIVSLKEAREERDKLKKMLWDKKDISKSTASTAKKFKNIAVEYFEKLKEECSQRYYKTEMDRYNKYLTRLDNLTLEELNKELFISIAKNIQATGAIEQGHRVLNLAKRILDFAVANDYLEQNFLANLPKGLILKKSKAKNYAHITEPKEFARLLIDIDSYYGNIITKLALQLAPLVFVRPANLRMMEWGEIDFEDKLWRIPAEKMKMDNAHIVPLSKQALFILEKAKEFKNSKYVFYSPTSTLKPLSENAINQALMRLGYKEKMTAHGFRHTASTLLHENIHIHQIPSEVIELQLAHTDKNKIRAVYNKAQFLDLRIKLMQWWGDYIEELKASIL